MSHTKVSIVADSVSPFGARITTFQVDAPRILLAEINTHRVLAKSAASSRAIPVEKRIEMVKREPWIPADFGKNQKGMQAVESLDPEQAAEAERIWKLAIEDALFRAKQLADVKLHKQYANRVLESYAYYTGVISGTEWDNFWWLRTSPDAQPEFRELACMMKEAYDKSVPRQTTLHTPFVDRDEFAKDVPHSTVGKVSAARCARVSYLSLKTGKRSTVDEDLELYEKLTSEKGAHLSPFDHPASADIARKAQDDKWYWCNPSVHRHNYGWIPYRVDVENSLGITCKRNSYDPLVGFNG